MLACEILLFAFVFAGVEAEISLEMALHGHYHDKPCHWEIDLVKALLPFVSEKHMREISGLPLVEGRIEGSIRHASPYQPTVGIVSPVRSLVSIPSSSPVGVQAGIGSVPTRKSWNLRVVLSSDVEIESDDTGLHPRKARRTVSVARLLGGIRSILSGQFFVLRQREVAVVPRSPEASPSPSAGSPLVIPGSDSLFGGSASSPGGSF